MEQQDKEKVRSGYCRDLARKLIRDMNIKRPPILVETIAKDNGFTIKLLDGQPKTFSGILHRELKAIGINTDHAKVRQRFSIAHELGHYYLQHPQEDESGFDDEAQAKWKIYEIEANEFGGELLVPKDFLKWECDQLTRIPLEEKINILVTKFLVSKDVVIIQLNKHKLLMKI